MKRLFFLTTLCLAINLSMGQNPITEEWYADPEATIFGKEYWIYPTRSLAFDEQLYMDAFSSKDLVNWTKHEKVLVKDNVSWLKRALWAPAAVYSNGKYYLFFAGNDVHQGEIGGIGVATSDKPEGPFKDALGHPLINEIINGAQPIDQCIFKDDDGEIYMYYGGWRHCNMVRLSKDMLSLVPFNDGTMYKEVTPEKYVEGPFMLKRNGTYYFMWSEGRWGGSDYCVAYAMSKSPFGPFKRIGKILESDENIGTGAGHHSVIKDKKGQYYIVYHRHPIGAKDGCNRVVCIDYLNFNEDGTIQPVKITFEGVKKIKL